MCLSGVKSFAVRNVTSPNPKGEDHNEIKGLPGRKRACPNPRVSRPFVIKAVRL